MLARYVWPINTPTAVVACTHEREVKHERVQFLDQCNILLWRFVLVARILDSGTRFPYYSERRLPKSIL